MKRIMILGLIAALLIPGCGQTDGNQVVMTISEYEAMKEAAETNTKSESETTETSEEESTEEAAVTPLATIAPKDDFKDGDLIGEWAGTCKKKEYADDNSVVETSDMDVFLAINSDNTFTLIASGDKKSGKWEKASESGRILSLLNVNSAGEQHDNGWSFGKLNGHFVLSFNDWHHYDVEMTKQ